MRIHLAIYHPKHAGILSAALTLKAEKIILLHRSEDEIAGIRSVIQSRGMQCEVQEVTFDTQLVREQFASIIEQYQSSELVFNASSGYQKLNLLGFEQFSNYGYPVFLVDKFTDELHWLNTRSTNSDIHLDHQLKIHECLKSFNTMVLEQGHSTPEPAASRQLTQWIIDHIGEYDQAIGSLNYMAMMANNSHSYELSNQEMKKHKLAHLLEHFRDAGKLTLRGRKLKFNDDNARFYCNGGWLENHVFALLYGIRGKRSHITDIARGLQIVRHNGRVKNELDVVAMSHNRLHIIECKTRRFSKSKAETTSASSAIYRLDTIKSITGGLSGRAMLISYQPLNKYLLSRAKDLGIYCCSHMQLKQLDRHLYHFFDNP
ncbi:Card1-like endonuclease domain-containing protein [Marinicella sediminis]|uniref:Card1-like endonuclease domain-containing protein n=1 Tax=Marinicella sediminis TaxID=1792834 RepID=A0ABV7J9I5_9GAMM|nr:DUF1887 family CARF protein [Marinicella sediminis]